MFWNILVSVFLFLGVLPAVISFTAVRSKVRSEQKKERERKTERESEPGRDARPDTPAREPGGTVPPRREGIAEGRGEGSGKGLKRPAPEPAAAVPRQAGNVRENAGETARETAADPYAEEAEKAEEYHDALDICGNEDCDVAAGLAGRTVEEHCDTPGCDMETPRAREKEDAPAREETPLPLAYQLAIAEAVLQRGGRSRRTYGR